MNHRCRLCGDVKEKRELFSAFEKQNLQENIERFHEIRILAADKICAACDVEIENFGRHMAKCVRAQREFYALKLEEQIQVEENDIKTEDPISNGETSVEVPAPLVIKEENITDNTFVDTTLQEKKPERSSIFDLYGQEVKLKFPSIVLKREKLSVTPSSCESTPSAQNERIENVKEVLHCSNCSFTTPDRYRLNQHFKEVHAKTFSCDQCGKCFGKASKLIQHKTSKHTDRSPVSCKLCNEKFTQKYLYTMHLKTHMSSGSLWPCDKCDKQFKQMHRLDVHKSKCHQSKKLSCIECAFVGKHEYALKQHIREVHKKSFMCDLCGKRESKKSRLLSHITKKHLEKIVYECEFCLAKYKSKKWYEYHKKSNPCASMY